MARERLVYVSSANNKRKKERDRPAADDDDDKRLVSVFVPVTLESVHLAPPPVKATHESARDGRETRAQTGGSGDKCEPQSEPDRISLATFRLEPDRIIVTTA